MSLIASLWLAGCSAEELPPIIVEGPDGTREVKPCGTGCSAPEPTASERMTDDEIRALLEQVASAPVGAPELPLETLLFRGEETRDYLIRKGPGPLSPEHARWLERELARDRVEVAFRLVDGEGNLLGHREDDVPVAHKRHMVLWDTADLGRLDVNGTVQRVGVKHLWARF